MQDAILDVLRRELRGQRALEWVGQRWNRKHAVRTHPYLAPESTRTINDETRIAVQVGLARGATSQASLRRSESGSAGPTCSCARSVPPSPERSPVLLVYGTVVTAVKMPSLNVIVATSPVAPPPNVKVLVNPVEPSLVM